jgi:glycosyltransferase involved in cell wall biosynthesis
MIGTGRAQLGKVERMFAVPARLNSITFDDVDVLHLHGDDWFFVRRDLPTVRTLYGSAWYEARTATSGKRRASQYAHAALELASARLATGAYGLGPGVPRAFPTIGNLDLGVVVPHDVTPSAARPPTVAFIGTWDGRKRGRLLWRAFSEVVQSKVPDAQLVMVADYAANSGGVTLLEAPTDEQIRALLQQAAVFCLPSSYEGFGIPYLEAMAAGCAVVATDNPGARHVLGEGLRGQIVSVDSLGRAIVDLLVDPVRRHRVAVDGRNRAQDFGWDRVAADHEVAYRRAIREWRPDRRAL